MKAKRYDSICEECAKEMHWRPIPYLQPTWWRGACGRCGEQKNVCAPSDYLGPKGEERVLWD